MLKALLPMIICLPFLFEKGYSQEVLASAGISVENSGYQLSWTIGEPLVETYSGDYSTLTQGFHQSNLIVTGKDQIPNHALNVKVYPNPFKDDLTIETVNNESCTAIRLILFDFTGKKLQEMEIINRIESISLRAYCNSNYLIQFYNHQSVPFQSFKIIRTE